MSYRSLVVSCTHLTQASVPFGIMMGYIIATILTSISRQRETCFDLLCWRWSFLIEVMLLTPLYLGLYFVPKEDIAVGVGPACKYSSSDEPTTEYTTKSVTAPPSDSYNRNSSDNLTDMGRNAEAKRLTNSLQQLRAPLAEPAVSQQGDVETGLYSYKSPERTTSDLMKVKYIINCIVKPE